MVLGEKDVHCFGCLGLEGQFVRVTLKRGSKWAGEQIEGWQHRACAVRYAQLRSKVKVEG
jgi:hypothetical protein